MTKAKSAKKVLDSFLVKGTDKSVRGTWLSFFSSLPLVDLDLK
jgi:hypothetical protein